MHNSQKYPCRHKSLKPLEDFLVLGSKLLIILYESKLYELKLYELELSESKLFEMLLSPERYRHRI